MKTKITNIGSVVTWSDDKKEIITLSNVEILIENGIIIEISKSVGAADEEVSAYNSLLTPGFVDSHTHPVFSGNRANEFSMRVAGKSYEEIANSGGGIISSVRGVYYSSEEQLFDEALDRLDAFTLHGTTTIEAKSGYGLSVENELKILRVIKRLNEEHPLDIIPTFLGAHAFPTEYENNRAGYIDVICNEMIPKVAEEGLAEFCDVFCEMGYFTVDDSRRILTTAQTFGLIPRLHADEFVDSGAAELAGEIGAISADHLMAVSDDGIRALSQNNVIATILPGTTFFLGRHMYAPGRKMIDMGCEVALATDFNPGSCTLQSMPIIMSMANLYCGMTIEEAFKGATVNGARAINRSDKLGVIKIGAQADLIFWSIDTLDEIPYWLGSDRILNVMKKGELIDD